MDTSSLDSFLFEPLPFQINGGISDAWYSPSTDGQGFFITVMEDLNTLFLAWYTYDTVSYDIPSIGRQGLVPIQRVSQANIANCQRWAIP